MKDTNIWTHLGIAIYDWRNAMQFASSSGETTEATIITANRHVRPSGGIPEKAIRPGA